MTGPPAPKPTFRQAASIAAGAALLLVVLVLFAFLPVTYKDWLTVFRPAALRWPAPYYTPGLVFNPPWLFPFLHPLALLPPRWGAGLLMLLSVVVVSLYVRSPLKLGVVVLAAPMSTLFALGQLDAVLLVGLMLPIEWGMPFLLLKPQGFFLLIARRLNRRAVVVAALTLAASVAGWGFWWRHIIGFQPNQTVNLSLFPYSTLIGLPLLYFGWKRNSEALLCLASLSFAPYFMITSALPAVAALVKETDDRRVWGAVIVVSWVYLVTMRVWMGQV